MPQNEEVLEERLLNVNLRITWALAGTSDIYMRLSKGKPDRDEEIQQQREQQGQMLRGKK